MVSTRERDCSAQKYTSFGVIKILLYCSEFLCLFFKYTLDLLKLKLGATSILYFLIFSSSEESQFLIYPIFLKPQIYRTRSECRHPHLCLFAVSEWKSVFSSHLLFSQESLIRCLKISYIKQGKKRSTKIFDEESFSQYEIL